MINITAKLVTGIFAIDRLTYLRDNDTARLTKVINVINKIDAPDLGLVLLLCTDDPSVVDD